MHATPATKPGPTFLALVGFLFFIGFAVRIAPMFDFDDRLLRQYPTEDGYFMLTIARNLVLGKGLAVSDGEIPTNGVQPFTTLLWTIPFLLSDGDRKSGVTGVLIFQILISFGAAFLLYRLTRKVLHDRPEREYAAMLAAAVWLSSKLTVAHSMNCLETGLYGLIVFAVALIFVEVQPPAPGWSLKRNLGVGFLLGVAFWVRNDAVFLILAACLTHLFYARSLGMEGVWRRFLETLIFGSTSVIVASPWLIHNYIKFGHIMPISGRAETITREYVGVNIPDLLPTLLEYASAVVAIPEPIEDHVLGWTGSGVVVLLLFALLPRVWKRATQTERGMLFLGMVYLGCFLMFYGLFFGAGWFMARYMFPVAGLLYVLWASVIVRLSATAIERGYGQLTIFAGAGLVALTGFLHLRTYRYGDEHLHFQVVKWVQQNVPDEVWVGAIQTGTLGFFHDRTINLDGKVNPNAYEALRDKRMAEYVVESEIEYLADWVGMIAWLEMPLVDANFKVLVYEPAENLTVLRRRASRRRSRHSLALSQDALDVARKRYMSAISEAEARVAEDPENVSHKNGLWIAYMGMGRQAVLAGEGVEASGYFEKAISLAESIVAAQPLFVQGKIQLAATYSELGDVQRVAGNLDAAITFFEKALALRLALHQADRGNTQWERDLAVAHAELAEVARVARNYDKAAQHFEEDFNIRRDMARKEPDNVAAQSELSMALNQLGELALEREDLDGAQRHFTQSMAVMAGLVQRDASTIQWQRDLGVIYRRLAEVARTAGNEEQSRSYSAQANDIARTLRTLGAHRVGDTFERTLELGRAMLGEEDIQSPRRQRGVAQSDVRMGDDARLRGEYDKARELYDRALKIYRELLHHDNTNPQWRHEMFELLINRGDVTADLKEARAFFEQAEDEAQNIANEYPMNAQWQRDLAIAYSKLGLNLKSAGEEARASEYFERARQHNKRDIGAAYHALGRTAQEAGDQVLAREYLEKAFAIRSKLVTLDSQNPSKHRELLLTCYRLMLLADARGDRESSRKYLDEQNQILDHFKQHRLYTYDRVVQQIREAVEHYAAGAPPTTGLPPKPL